MIDGHAHLDEIEAIEAVVARARTAGIEAILAVGMDLASNEATIALAHRYPGYVLPAIGYHPWSILRGEVERNLEFLRGHIHECVALGEVGLDYGAKAKKPSSAKSSSRSFGSPGTPAVPSSSIRDIPTPGLSP